MANAEKFLLNKYFNLGWLSRCYFNGKSYCQPYSAADRLLAGRLLYADFITWQKGCHLVRDYNMVKVDVSFVEDRSVPVGFAVERFRKALRIVSKASLPVIYKIVLEEHEIQAPKQMAAREKLYFNDEIKGLLCRGLDELIVFYKKNNG